MVTDDGRDSRAATSDGEDSGVEPPTQELLEQLRVMAAAGKLGHADEGQGVSYDQNLAPRSDEDLVLEALAKMAPSGEDREPAQPELEVGQPTFKKTLPPPRGGPDESTGDGGYKTRVERLRAQRRNAATKAPQQVRDRNSGRASESEAQERTRPHMTTRNASLAPTHERNNDDPVRKVVDFCRNPHGWEGNFVWGRDPAATQPEEFGQLVGHIKALGAEKMGVPFFSFLVHDVALGRKPKTMLKAYAEAVKASGLEQEDTVGRFFAQINRMGNLGQLMEERANQPGFMGTIVNLQLVGPKKNRDGEVIFANHKDGSRMPVLVASLDPEVHKAAVTWFRRNGDNEAAGILSGDRARADALNRRVRNALQEAVLASLGLENGAPAADSDENEGPPATEDGAESGA